MTTGPSAPTSPLAGHIVAHTLLNCLLREVCGPEHQTAVSDGHLLLRLPRCGELLRVRLRRTSLIGAHRFTGPVTAQHGGTWSALPWQALAECIHRELALRTGFRNDEFLDQVAASHAGVAAALATAGAGDHPADPYLASEQSLLFGHRFHPTPKARTGTPEDWRRYAPEARARFALRHLAVRRRYVRQEAAAPGAPAAFERQGGVPDGYVLLPAHPWQYGMLRDHPALRAAVARRDVLDLGPRGTPFAPTASVRTLYDGRDFLKFSLNVRITNCLRKNAEYELAGAVALTRLLAPAAADLAARFPGTALLGEPAYRTLDLGSRDLAEGFGVIARDGLGAHLAPGLTALLAAAVADEYPSCGAQLGRLLDGRSQAEALAWWDAYLRLLIPPVLAAYFDHGVVLEPHLQNVVIGIDDRGSPLQVVFRDLEGTKLLTGHPGLAGLDEMVARPMTYGRERGWDRVVYCLLVNHVAEMLAALADRHPRLEGALWSAVRRVLADRAAAHGQPPLLRALVAGVPLPAKANLITRWQRLADRDAGYVRIGSPLVPDVLSALRVLPEAGTRAAGGDGPPVPPRRPLETTP
ncbi:siderophore synthetase component [Streptomyces olivoverticillatus]|uniref:Siderophore synthetase component n=1 Tax=Streptomyces olivoverticillatus TaxID=66427 RepID=A0A7W7LSP5_9ACTN|nr:IucA/IucC family protein [Streptomyces olivoverticillatus]MBB4894926.1 siderophore synthetase component [Streptomyces olivoverticillatus]